jgi:hypothetical protein
MITPVVAVDIDGTLGDYHGHFLSFAASYLGDKAETVYSFLPELKMYRGNEKFSLYCQELFGIDLRTFREIKLAYRQGGLKRSMPMNPGAVGLFEMLHAYGVEVWLTTTRPYLRLDGVDPDTRFWLERHGIKYYGLIYDEDKYSVLADRIEKDRVVAILDDLPEQYDAAEVLFGREVPILVRNLYNTQIGRYNMALTLEGASERIESRLRVWNSRFKPSQK